MPVRAEFEEYQKYNWVGAVRFERDLRGKTKVRRADIGNSAGPGSCWFTEMPEVGDLWVLYTNSNVVSFSLPIEVARSADSTLSGLLPKEERP